MVLRECFSSPITRIEQKFRAEPFGVRRARRRFRTRARLSIREEKNAPERIRTTNLLIRSQMLYPVELRALERGS